MNKPIESGEIFFFYCSRLEVSRPGGVKDLQRLFLVLVSDGADRARLLVVGRKQLPEIRRGESHAAERDWLLVYLVAEPGRVGRALHPVSYETARQGDRLSPEAIPAGAGLYAIVRQGDATQLAVRLVTPEQPGDAQQSLGIRSEASYVIAVRNPAVQVEGFPDESPDYPQALAERFADERWIDVVDPRLLDYEHAQLVLIGAMDTLDHLDVDLGKDVDLFSALDLDEREWPTGSLREGKFVAAIRSQEPVEAAADRSKGGRRGGREAVKTDSAAGVAAALAGIEFPRARAGLVRQARHNDAPDEVIELLEQIADQEYGDMADVARAVGEVR